MAHGGPPSPFSELPGAPPPPPGGFGASPPTPGWGLPPLPQPARPVLQLALIGGAIVVFLGALASAAAIVWFSARPGVAPAAPGLRELPPGWSVAPTTVERPSVPLPVAPQLEAKMFGAKHLLVMYRGSLRSPATIERTKEEARARAVKAQQKAKNGAAFADVVREYSDEPGAAARGGDLGTFKKGAMVPEFQAAVEELAVGQISEVVETGFGYHVILRTQ